MSAVLAVQPTATLDEFLADPLVALELEAVLAKTDVNFAPIAVLKVREFPDDYKQDPREKLSAHDAARWLLRAWRDHRP